VKGRNSQMRDILVIEDNPAMRNMLRLLLQKRGHTVLEAEDLEQRISRVLEEPSESAGTRAVPPGGEA
jgi:CheY-like chemotaxis protein